MFHGHVRLYTQRPVPHFHQILKRGVGFRDLEMLQGTLIGIKCYIFMSRMKKKSSLLFFKKTNFSID